jgi:hypothetical protein
MTNTTAEDARLNYVTRQVFLDAHARALPKTMPLTKGIVRQYARIAWNAAKAEQHDVEPEPVMPCRVCRGVRVCDVDAHRALGWH